MAMSPRESVAEWKRIIRSSTRRSDTAEVKRCREAATRHLSGLYRMRQDAYGRMPLRTEVGALRPLCLAIGKAMDTRVRDVVAVKESMPVPLPDWCQMPVPRNPSVHWARDVPMKTGEFAGEFFKQLIGRANDAAAKADDHFRLAVPKDIRAVFERYREEDEYTRLLFGTIGPLYHFGGIKHSIQAMMALTAVKGRPDLLARYGPLAHQVKTCLPLMPHPADPTVYLVGIA